jgi:DNA-binding Xre family transcriptional regulator
MRWVVKERSLALGMDVRDLHRKSGVYRESLDRIWANESQLVAISNLERLRAALELEHIGQLFEYLDDTQSEKTADTLDSGRNPGVATPLPSAD